MIEFEPTGLQTPPLIQFLIQSIAFKLEGSGGVSVPL